MPGNDHTIGSSGEGCASCGPNDLREVRQNGRLRVEIPETFMAERLGAPASQLAEAMAVAEQLQTRRPTRPPATPSIMWPQPAATPGIDDATPVFTLSEQPPRPSSPGSNSFTLAETPFASLLGAGPGAANIELPRSTPDHPGRSNNFTLAETEYANLLGIGPPAQFINNQFTLAETDAAELVPVQAEEKKAPKTGGVLPLPDPDERETRFPYAPSRERKTEADVVTEEVELPSPKDLDGEKPSDTEPGHKKRFEIPLKNGPDVPVKIGQADDYLEEYTDAEGRVLRRLKQPFRSRLEEHWRKVRQRPDGTHQSDVRLGTADRCEANVVSWGGTTFPIDMLYVDSVEKLPENYDHDNAEHRKLAEESACRFGAWRIVLRRTGSLPSELEEGPDTVGPDANRVIARLQKALEEYWKDAKYMMRATHEALMQHIGWSLSAQGMNCREPCRRYVRLLYLNAEAWLERSSVTVGPPRIVYSKHGLPPYSFEKEDATPDAPNGYMLCEVRYRLWLSYECVVEVQCRK